MLQIDLQRTASGRSFEWMGERHSSRKLLLLCLAMGAWDRQTKKTKPKTLQYFSRMTESLPRRGCRPPHEGLELAATP